MMAEPQGTVENRGAVVLAVTTAFLVASTAFIVLRLISRIGIVKKVSKDDYFIILAWVRMCFMGQWLGELLLMML